MNFILVALLIITLSAFAAMFEMWRRRYEAIFKDWCDVTNKYHELLVRYHELRKLNQKVPHDRPGRD